MGYLGLIVPAIGLVMIGWPYILRKEKIGDMLIPPNNRIKLYRIISYSVIALGNMFLRSIKNDILFYALWIATLGLFVALFYIETEETIKTTKEVWGERDPKIWDDYVTDRRTKFNIFAACIALAFMVFGMSFLK